MVVRNKPNTTMPTSELVTQCIRDGATAQKIHGNKRMAAGTTRKLTAAKAVAIAGSRLSAWNLLDPGRKPDRVGS
jgi:hypothetical protein